MAAKQTIINRFRPTRCGLPDQATTGYGIAGGTTGFINIYGYSYQGQPLFTKDGITPTGYPAVAPSGFNWNNLVWNSPPSFRSGSAVLTNVGHLITLNIPSNPGLAANDGFMPAYTGPAVNCTAIITVNSNTGGATGQLFVLDFTNSVLILLRNFSGTSATVPFIIPISAGIVYQIQYTGDSGGFGGSINYSISLTPFF